MMYHMVIVVGLLLCLAALYQKLATVVDDYKYPPPGKLIDIDGYKLHLNASGEGKIAVVCDAGLSGTSLGWSLMQPEVSKFARICSYDRAGYAWSDPSPLERTSINIATELYSLLKKGEIPGPYILVGHSFGGANLLMFADLYPEETLGVILVDSVHEEMREEFPYSPVSSFFQWFLSAIGFKRLKGPSEEIEKMFLPLPEKTRDAYIAQMNKTLYTETVNKEMSCLQKSLSQLGERKILLQVPLTVISAGIVSNDDKGKKWKFLQKKHLLKSEQSQQIIAEESDHMINHHQPQVIVEAIREMIEIQSQSL